MGTAPAGDALVLDLDEELARATDALARERSGRSSRVLLRSGPLRVTLIVLAPGGEIPEHHAAGSITVQPLRGAMRFTAGGRDHDLRPGRMLCLPPRVRHRVASDAGGAFLLTVAGGAAPMAPLAGP